MQSSRVGKYEIWYENSEEFYELKKEIFGENCYYFDDLSFDYAQDKSMKIIDLGAHIGITVLYFKMLFPKAKIIAYEPVPANFALLEKNVRENQLEGVELIQAVVAPKTGSLVIHEPGGEGAWKSGAGIIPRGWRNIQDGAEIRVSAVGIQEVLENKVDFLKMDIEGMEYEVIRNMGSKMRNILKMIIEVHPRKDHRIGEIEKILRLNKFKIEIKKDKSSLGRGLAHIFVTQK